MTTPAPSGPRVRGNDWSCLDRPPLGQWTPRRSVSVVVPAYEAGRTLPYVLAALRAQSYPAHLLEVVVVDDGSSPSLELPELRPDNTRIIRAADSWGRANACREGAAASDGDVIHWLDADMVPCRDQVEAQMRWHHQLDHAVVLGHKLFVDAEDLPGVDAVLAAVEQDTLEALLEGRWRSEHEWVEQVWRSTADLQQSGFRPFPVHVGATASVARDLYDRAGGMDPGLRLGEDIELGYRLTTRGGVFVADREARSWHLGRSTVMQHEEQVRRYNAPFISHRVPDFRKMRQDRGRTYRVPFVETVVRVGDHGYDEVRHSVDGVLRSLPGDVRCVLVAPWSRLDEARRHPLRDELLDLRLLREEYATEPRVELVEEVAPTAFPATFRLHLPAGWRPARALAEVPRQMRDSGHGLRSVLLPDGRTARFELTAAFERALHVRAPDEDVDDVVDQVAGSWWSEGVEIGFLHPELAPPPGRAAGKPAPAAAPPTAPAPPGVEARRPGLGRLRARRRRAQG